MNTKFKWNGRMLPVLACIALVSWNTISSRRVTEAQEPSSIVGSSPLYGLKGATGWINSKPLTAKELKGKVVLVASSLGHACLNQMGGSDYAI
jgi:hypothetical protein